MNEPMLFVSVVIVSKDRRRELILAVASLQLLDYPRTEYEVIVVEEGDEPAPITGVRYVFLPRRNLGLGYARNTGVREAKGEIIAFTDDDCLVDPLWLKSLVAGFSAPDVLGVAGATFAQQNGLIGMCEDILGFPGGGHKRYHRCGGRTVATNLLSTCNCAYRREVFAQVRFKEDGFARLGGEDFWLGLAVSRLGRCQYLPQAVAYHKPRGSLSKIIAWFARRRLVELLMEEKQENRKSYASVLKRPHRVMLFRWLAALALPVGWGMSGLGALLLIGGVWYAFVLARNYPVTKYFQSRLVPLVVPVVRFFMDVGVALGEWRYLVWSREKFGLTLNEYRR